MSHVETPSTPAGQSTGGRYEPAPDLWTVVLDVVVVGSPTSQGSKRSVPIYRGPKTGTREFTGKVAQIEQTAGKLGPWRDAVRSEAVAAWTTTAVLDEPVRLLVTFTPKWRPQSHPKTRETWPAGSPDIDKLLRGVSDALKDAGVVRDDALFVDAWASKRWPNQPAPKGMPTTPAAPGCHLQLLTLSDPACRGDRLPANARRDKRAAEKA